MFKKPFNVKKNTNQRNSDSRKLFTRLKEEVNLESNIDKKGQVAQVKITNFENTQLQFYTIDKIPTLFEFSDTGNIYPSVYYLWKNPKAFPVLVCHEPVFQFLENGADLMLPGVIRSEKFEFPTFRKGAPVAIAFYSSENGTVTGPSAVGCSIVSSEDVLRNGFKGKGVQVLHVFRDQLWDFGPKGLPPTYTLEEWNSLGKEAEIVEEEEEGGGEGGGGGGVGSSEQVAEDEEDEEVISETMEQVLLRCFLAGLKNRFTRNMLPMDVGQFYTQVVLSCVPDGRKLDMKKTKYKKFGTFIQEVNQMSDTWIIHTSASKEKKGADVVTEVNFSNKMFRDFEVTDERIVDEAPESDSKEDRPAIAEFLSITEPTLALFPGHSKGDLLTVKQIKDFVTKYVNENHLSTAKSVRLDPRLASITHLKSECATWQDVMKEIHSRMTATWYIRWPDGREIVRKVTAPRIEFKIENRAGNKKVTLINGLPMFGIDIKTICHQIQVGVATSVTSQWDVPGVEGPQVVVQGNQIHYIADLLMKTYGIDKKFLKGTELAVKKRK
uniref:Eukaryotic translation initiation factor 2D n=1 Tax=Caenorhabditis japonica TaxID=281687 RepID=A0A8R1HSK7_CAEJA